MSDLFSSEQLLSTEPNVFRGIDKYINLDHVACADLVFHGAVYFTIVITLYDGKVIEIQDDAADFNALKKLFFQEASESPERPTPRKSYEVGE